jgi:type IV secretory pathway TrbD component
MVVIELNTHVLGFAVFPWVKAEFTVEIWVFA